MINDVLRLTPTLATSGGSELEGLIHPKPNTAVVDLRQAVDFDQFRLPGSVNVPFVHRDTPGPFADPKTLKDLWQQLEDTFKSPNQDLQALIDGKRVLLLCYDGDSARVATSVLRAKGYEADSLRGGFKALSEMRTETAAALPSETAQQDTLWLKLSCEAGRLAAPEPSHAAVAVNALQ